MRAPPINIRMPEQFLRNLVCTYIMVPESISTVYFIYPSHPLMCLYVYPLIVARQQLGEKSYRGNEYGSNNRGNIVCAKGFGPRK
jgi:hypothetical protein